VEIGGLYAGHAAVHRACLRAASDVNDACRGGIAISGILSVVPPSRIMFGPKRCIVQSGTDLLRNGACKRSGHLNLEHRSMNEYTWEKLCRIRFNTSFFFWARPIERCKPHLVRRSVFSFHCFFGSCNFIRLFFFCEFSFVCFFPCLCIYRVNKNLYLGLSHTDWSQVLFSICPLSPIDKVFL